MNKVVNRSVFLTFMLYLFIGCAGYLDFAQYTNSDILINFDPQEELITALSFIAIAVTVVLAFPLNVFPCRYTLDVMFYKYILRGEELAPPTSRTRHVAFTLLICGGALIIALCVPGLSKIFQLMGGTASAFVCFIVPAMFAIIGLLVQWLLLLVVCFALLFQYICYVPVFLCIH